MRTFNIDYEIKRLENIVKMKKKVPCAEFNKEVLKKYNNPMDELSFQEAVLNKSLILKWEIFSNNYVI